MNDGMDINLTPAQAAFYQSTAHDRAFIGGVGSGKTFVILRVVLDYAIAHPGSVSLIVSPTNQLLRDTILPSALKQINDYYQSRYKRHTVAPSTEIKLYALDPVTGKGGTSIIRLRTGDTGGNNLLGMEIAIAAMDEAARMDKSVYDICQARLRQPGFEHCMLISSTPRGLDWIYETFVANESPDHFLIRSSTRENAANLVPGYIERLEHEYGPLFQRQELEGEFITLNYLVYSEFDPSVHMLDIKNIGFHRYTVGVDWGFTDPLAVVVVGTDSHGGHCVTYEFLASNLSSSQVVAEMVKIRNKFTLGNVTPTFYADPSRPELILDCQNAGLEMYQANNMVLPGIDRVKRMLAAENGRPGIYISRTCQSLRSSLLQYHWGEKGATGMQQPNHEASDLCDALRYVLLSGDFERGLPDRIVISQENCSIEGMHNEPCPDSNGSYRSDISWMYEKLGMQNLENEMEEKFQSSVMDANDRNAPAPRTSRR